MNTKSKKWMGAALAAVLAVGAGGVALAHGGGGKRFAKKAEMLEKYDANKDGELSREEMRAAREARRAEMLAKFDSNKDGQLDDKERTAAHEARLAERFRMLDANKDNVVSWDEFKSAGPQRGFRGGHE